MQASSAGPRADSKRQAGQLRCAPIGASRAAN